MENKKYELVSMVSSGVSQDDYELIEVKLTDAALKFIEQHSKLLKKNERASNLKISFNGNKAEILAQNDSNKALSQKINFTMTPLDPQNRPDVLQSHARENKMTTLGKLKSKMVAMATDDTYQLTRERMAQAEEESKKSCAQEIKPGGPKVGRVVRHIEKPSKNSKPLKTFPASNILHHPASASRLSNNSKPTGLSSSQSKNDLGNNLGNASLANKAFNGHNNGSSQRSNQSLNSGDNRLANKVNNGSVKVGGLANQQSHSLNYLASYKSNPSDSLNLSSKPGLQKLSPTENSLPILNNNKISPNRPLISSRLDTKSPFLKPSPANSASSNRPSPVPYSMLGNLKNSSPSQFILANGTQQNNVHLSKRVSPLLNNSYNTNTTIINNGFTQNNSSFTNSTHSNSNNNTNNYLISNNSNNTNNNNNNNQFKGEKSFERRVHSFTQPGSRKRPAPVLLPTEELIGNGVYEESNNPSFNGPNNFNGSNNLSLNSSNNNNNSNNINSFNNNFSNHSTTNINSGSLNEFNLLKSIGNKPTVGENVGGVGMTTDASHSLRERLIHILALKSYRKTELLQKVEKELGSNRSTYWWPILNQVGHLNTSNNQYSLSRPFYGEVNPDSNYYSTIEKLEIKRILAKIRDCPIGSASNSPELSPYSANHVSSKKSGLLPGLDSYSEPVAKKKRIAHVQQQGGNSYNNQNNSNNNITNNNGNNSDPHSKSPTDFQQANNSNNGSSTNGINANQKLPNANNNGISGSKNKKSSGYNLSAINGLTPNVNGVIPTVNGFNPITNGAKMDFNGVSPLSYINEIQANINKDGTAFGKDIPHLNGAVNNKYYSTDREGDPIPVKKTKMNGSAKIKNEKNLKEESQENFSIGLSSSPEYYKKYAQVLSDRQRDEAIREFDADYIEYQSLYNSTKNRTRIISDLNERLKVAFKNGDHESSEELKQLIYDEYRELRSDTKYLEQKERTNELYEKLNHIKSVVYEYEDNNNNSHNNNNNNKVAIASS